MDGEELTPPERSLSFIWNRRSVSRLVDPGPNREELNLILKAGSTAPDHGLLRPWRFIVFEGESRIHFGEILAEALLTRIRENLITPTSSQLEKERNKLLRAPLIIVVAAKIDTQSTIPAIEQFAASAAACENMLLAATSLGFGSMWRTGEPSYDETVKHELGLRATDLVTGWLYFGTIDKRSKVSSPKPEVDNHVTFWQLAEQRLV